MKEQAQESMESIGDAEIILSFVNLCVGRYGYPSFYMDWDWNKAMVVEEVFGKVMVSRYMKDRVLK